ncbi:hypothetical protein TUM4438_19460 [Shewanella sairae]|uniref:Tail specific protease domain-containing protein n=1 Tax=Shewanella sairae TaxID=190310 RepID=A0ABQ4PDK2_9GAMM|nr:S41 family peptidase [Shewanella sairae]MCL1129415.1 S41 family peptidase [Shewanella sairae]GIU45601.1 hypothetical protein TUM4438_19460 [Shewanella sairae]
MILSFRGAIATFAILILVSIAQLAYLSFYPHSYSSQLNREQYQQDIQYFIDAIKQHSAFAVLNPQNLQQLETASQQLAGSANKRHSAAQLEQQLQLIASRLNDPAASVYLPISTQSSLQELPLTLRFDGQHWHGFTTNTLSISEELPYLTHIDGIPMGRWVKASQAYLADPLKLSPQAQASGLTQIVRLRQDIGLAAKDNVTVTFSNGEVSKQVTLPLTVSTAGDATDLASTLIKNTPPNQALVRLDDQIDETTIARLSLLLAARTKQNKISATMPLALDIRAIKQAQPALMNWLQTHFAAQQGRTIGVLRYKRYPTSRADHIAKDYMPLKQLSFFEQTQLTDKGFENHLNQNLALSDYLVRQHNSAQVVIQPKASTKPKLTLLVDSSCEQECEWLALASQQWPEVELIGEKTRGSLSPRYQTTLPNSGIRLQFSQGVIYDPNGQLISGIGLAPAMQINQLAFENHRVTELIAAQKLIRSLAPLKGTVANANAEKR